MSLNTCTNYKTFLEHTLVETKDKNKIIYLRTCMWEIMIC